MTASPTALRFIANTAPAWLFISVLLLATLPVPAGTAPLPPPSAAPSPPDASALMAGVFTENMGQVPGEIMFYSASAGIAFAPGQVLLQPPGAGPVFLTFPGSNPASPSGRDVAGWDSNFFLGNDPSGWRTGVSNYRGVVYENIWDGIDLVYRMAPGGIKYDFIVAPGADHGQIRVRAEGHDGLALAHDGSLSMALGNGAIRDSGLEVFHSDEPDEKLDAEFELLDAHTYTFRVLGRDMTRELVIDPLIYSTFLGGAGSDHATDIAVDGDGCAYVVGNTTSLGFPTTLGALGTDHFGYTYDIFVTKISPAGDSLIYSTFLGHEGMDVATSITIDEFGQVHITGYTSSDGFPTTQGAFDRTYNGDTFDAFVVKLGAHGDSLVFSTFLGGSRVDIARGVAVDLNGYVYVTGDTWSHDLPLSPDALFRVFNAGQTGGNDAFVIKLTPSGDALVYSTFLGGGDYDYATAIAVDQYGCAYVTGYTRSAGFPTTPGAFDRSHGGGYDAFATKFSRTGRSLMFSTFLGGSSSDVGHSIAVGRWGEAYVTGYTHSTDFPTTSGAFDTTHNGWADAFVTALGRNGDSLIYSTFLGGAGSDIGYGIAVDREGSVHVVGYTNSADFPVTPQAFGMSYTGNGDGFVAKLRPMGDALSYSTYLGGSGPDICHAVAVDPSDFTLVSGETVSLNFPTTPESMDWTYNGQTDAFITKLDMAAPVADAGPDQWIDEGFVARFDGRGSTDNHGIVNHTWTFHDGLANVTLHGTRPYHNFTLPGIYPVTLTVLDATGNMGADSMNLTVRDITPPTAVAGPDITVDEGSEVTFNGTASSDNVGIAAFTWRFTHGPGEVTLHGESPAFTFTVPGIHNVTLEVADAAGNVDSDGMLVTVNDITPPVAVAGPDRSVYAGSSLTFDGSASRDNVGIVSMTWQFHDGTSQVTLHGPGPEHLFRTVGVYPVTLDVTDAAGHRGTDTMQVTVLETVPPVAVAGPDISVDEGSVTRFDGSASTDNVGVVRWEWSFSDGINNATLHGVSPSWTFTRPGTYTVILTVHDAAGNSAADSITVTVLDVLDPVAVPGPGLVLRSGEAASFDGTGSFDSSGIASHTWTFIHNGTEVKLEGALARHIFWTPGTYTVNLTVTDNAGRTGTARMTVAVLPPGRDDVLSGGSGIAVPAFLAATILIFLALALWRRGGKGAVP